MSTKRLGETLRDLRKEKGLPLRKVAAALDIDVAILSKMERGERKLTREIVVKMAEHYQQDLEPLMIQYLSEKVLYEIGDEPLAQRALQAAESELQYVRQKPKPKNVLSREELTQVFAEYLSGQHLVNRAWLFGSMARGDSNAKSDVDVAIDVPKKTPFTFFDLAEVQENFKKLARRKVDVVMINGIRPAMRARLEKEMILFYEATHSTRDEIIKKMVAYVQTDKRVLAAWIFGSFARGDMNPTSDIDLMIRLDQHQKVSLFGFAEIAYELEKAGQRKIDMVEEGQIKSFALRLAEKDMIKIYELEENILNLS